MGEVETFDVARRTHQLRLQRLIDGGERGFFIEVGHGRGDFERKCAIERGANRQQAIGRLGKSRKAPANQLANSFGNAEFFNTDLRSPAAPGAKDFALFEEMQQQFADEEGIAVSSFVERFHQRGGCILIANHPEQVRDLVGGEPFEAEIFEIPRPAHRGYRAGKWMLTIHLRVTVGAQQQDRIGGNEMRHMTDHRYRAAIGPMEIIEYQQHGGPLCNRDEELGDRIEQPKPFILFVERSGFVDAVDRCRAVPGQSAR